MNTDLDIEMKKPRGRPSLLDLGIKRTDANYYKHYYSRQLNSVVQCQHCDCSVVAVKLARHYKSKKCIRTRKLNEFLNDNPEEND
jgi:hypothetical protein